MKRQATRLPKSQAPTIQQSAIAPLAHAVDRAQQPRPARPGTERENTYSAGPLPAL